MKTNPAYKGKCKFDDISYLKRILTCDLNSGTAPLIDNPAYKGVWAPRKIPNPDYFEDNTPSKFEPIAGIGIELWTMQENILFDNVRRSRTVFALIYCS